MTDGGRGAVSSRARDNSRSSPDQSAHYGRRHGHKLRPHRARLLAGSLPELRVNLPQSGARSLKPLSLFPVNTTAVWLEIGFGAGEHLAAQAEIHPTVGLIGCEPFVNGVASLLSKIDGRGLQNIRIYPDDALPLIDSLVDASIDRAFVLFPDPWPKSRHHKRRFIQARALDALARVLADNAELRLATDYGAYARWMLTRCRSHAAFEWTARSAADWRIRPTGWPETRYEAKARGQNRPGIFLTFRRIPR